MSNKKSKKNSWTIFLILLLEILIFGGAFFYFLPKGESPKTNEPVSEISAEEVDDRVEPVQNLVVQYVKDGFIMYDPNMQPIKSYQDIPENQILAWYTDPLCPSCVRLKEILGNNATKANDEGMYMKYHTLAFLSPNSVDDYSARASTYILGVTEFAPELSYAYMSKIMTDKFYPTGNIETSDTEFRILFTEVGGTEEVWNKVLENYDTFYKIVEDKTAEVVNDRELVKRTVTGGLAVPFLIVGDSDKGLDFSQTEDVATFFTESIDTYLNYKMSGRTVLSIDGLLKVYQPDSEINIKAVSDYTEFNWYWIAEDSVTIVPSENKTDTFTDIVTIGDNNRLLVVEALNNGILMEKLTIKIVVDTKED